MREAIKSSNLPQKTRQNAAPLEADLSVLRFRRRSALIDVRELQNRRRDPVTT
jgi:hypothetical protein